MGDATPSPPRPPVPRGLWVVLALGIASIGSRPWLATLDQIPMTADGRMWLERGDPGAEGWAEWVFRTRHFHVGYRPVAALTYSATMAVTGPVPGVLRATDLALHLAVALTLALLARRIAPRAPPWSAALAGLLYLLHPVAEDVVPYVARRSYTLSLLFVLLAQLLLLRRAAGVGASLGDRKSVV